MNKIKNKILFLIVLLILSINFGVIFSVPRYAISAASNSDIQQLSEGDGKIEVDVNDILGTTGGNEYYNYSEILEQTWQDEAINLHAYRDYLTKYGTDKEVVVAVLSTGIRTGHEIFKNRIATDEDGNLLGCAVNDMRKFKDDLSEYAEENPILEDYPYYEFEDDGWYGTAVSSIICSLTPTNVKILPIKIASADGTWALHIEQGLQKALEYKRQGVNIVAVYSYATHIIREDMNSDTSWYKRYEKAVKDLRDANVLTSVTAGTYDWYETTGKRNICATPSAIVVSDLRKTKDKEGNIVFKFIDGANSFNVDLCAPSHGAYYAQNPGHYEKDLDLHDIFEADYELETLAAFSSGDHKGIGAAVVAAAIAMLTLEENYYNSAGEPIYTVDMIEQRLKNSATYMGETGGYGLINLANLATEISYESTNVETTYNGQAHNIVISTNIKCNVTYSLTENGEYNITDITKIKELKNAVKKRPIYFKLTALNETDAKYLKETKGVVYLTVNPIVLEGVIKANQTCVYGEIQLDQTQYEITTKDKVLQGDENDFYIGTDATNRSRVGKYDLFIASKSGNYTIETKTRTLTIKPRNISIKLGTVYAQYGDDANPSEVPFEVVTGEIKNNDVLNLNFSTTADSSSVVGTYEISATNTNDNYNVTVLEGEYLVTPRKVIIKMKDSVTAFLGVFNANLPEWVIVSGEVEDDDDLQLSIFSDVNTKKFGEYSSWATSNNPNYDVLVLKGVVKVKLTDFQLLIVTVIALMIICAIIVVITIILRKTSRKRRLKKAAKFDRQTII